MSVLEKPLKSNVLLLWIQNIFILFSNGVFPPSYIYVNLKVSILYGGGVWNQLLSVQGC